MERFRTIVTPDKLVPSVRYEDPIMILGSCFAEEIGSRLEKYKFNVQVNPFGILYNPVSIAICLQRLISAESYVGSDLVTDHEVWHSFDHHGRFSHTDQSICLNRINDQLKSSSAFLRQTRYLIITFGSARVFHLTGEGRVISNCHQFPANKFETELLRVGDIVHSWQRILSELTLLSPEIRIILTISPVRYLKEGAQGNQVSKATLILADWELAERVPGVYYFPSYEIFMDDLRDYRFYGKDLVHPGDLGTEYIWDRFQEACLDPANQPVMNEVQELLKATNHRPRGHKTAAYHKFLETHLSMAESLQVKYPFMSFQAEVNYFKDQLTVFTGM